MDTLFAVQRRLSGFLESRSAAVFFTYCFLLALVLGIIDYFTTPDYTFAIFYLIPVTITAWYYGGTYGALMSVSCTVIAFFAALLWPKTVVSSPYVIYWDAATNLAFFSVTSSILAKLKSTIISERMLARTDYLTGISNARYFYELTETAIKRAHRLNTDISIVYLDLDNFKEVNDTLGHQEGDLVLRMGAGILKNNVRDIDLVARLGGDEFAILMPDTGFEEAGKVISRVKSMLDSVLRSERWKVTASMGAVTCPGRVCSVDSLITMSDRLMFEAKTKGKNGIVHKKVE